MTPELTALALAALLQIVHFSIYSVLATRQVGLRYSTGPRDTPRQLTGMAGRAQRAMNNHFEGLILFTIAVLVVVLSGQSTPYTATCAWVYFGARVAYVPAYMLGLAPWRSAIWFAGLGATAAMLASALV
jgi:uncharacterized MAPEG superfamily protein